MSHLLPSDDTGPDAPLSRDPGRSPSKLDKATYVHVRSKLDFRPSLLPTIAILTFSLCLLAAACVLLRRGGTGPFILSQILLAIFFFNNFSLLHECGHGTASRWPLFNTVLGHLASTFCFTPYYPWKYIHQKHHVWTGNMEKDPVLKSLKKFRDRGVPKFVRLAWLSWIPVTGLLQHVVFLTYPLVMWRSGEMTRGKLVRTIVSVLWLPVSYAALWALAPDIMRPSNLILALALYLFTEELVNLPHHVGMPVFEGRLPLWEQHRSTRSCYYPRGISELIVLNFNFHIEHHLFPTLPWYRLRKARALLREAMGDDYTQCVGVSWNVHNRTRDLDAIVARYRTRGSEAS